MVQGTESARGLLSGSDKETGIQLADLFALKTLVERCSNKLALQRMLTLLVGPSVGASPSTLWEQTQVTVRDLFETKELADRVGGMSQLKQVADLVLG